MGLLQVILQQQQQNEQMARLKELDQRQGAVQQFHTLREIMGEKDPTTRDALMDYWGSSTFGKDIKPQLDTFRKILKGADEERIGLFQRALDDAGHGIATGNMSVRDAYGLLKDPIAAYQFVKKAAVDRQTKELLTGPVPQGAPEGPPPPPEMGQNPTIMTQKAADPMTAVEAGIDHWRQKASQLVSIGAPKEAVDLAEKNAAALEGRLTRMGDTQTETIVDAEGTNHRVMFNKRTGAVMRVLGNAGKDTQVVSGTDANGDPTQTLVNKNTGQPIAELPAPGPKYATDADRIAGELYQKPFNRLNKDEMGAVNKKIRDDRLQISREQGAAAIDLKNQQPVGTAAPTLIDPKTMKSPPTTMTKDAAIKGGFVEVPEKERAALADLEQTRAILGTITTFANKLMTAESAFARTRQAAMLHAGALSGADPAAATYQAQRSAFLGILSRTLGGEKGVLTDRDVARIDSALPSFGDSKTTKDLKLGLLNNLLQTATEAKVSLMTGQPMKSDALERIQKLLDTAEKAAGRAAPAGNVDDARKRLGL
jgi:hypothetical protein